MDISNKMLMDLADEVGLKNNDRLSAQRMEEMKRKAESLQGKGEDEILSEIMGLKEALRKDRKAYNKQMAAIRAMRPMMNAEQRARLDRIISLIES